MHSSLSHAASDNFAAEKPRMFLTHRLVSGRTMRKQLKGYDLQHAGYSIAADY